MTENPVFTIRLACDYELPSLREIERSAAELFRQTKFVDQVNHVLPLEFLIEQQKHDRVWVAVDENDNPVGFAVALIIDGLAHLDELSVEPSCSRKGVGTRLIAAVCEWARGEKCAGVTLFTFRDIAWNAPFYRRLGFRELKENEMGDGLRKIRSDEIRAGLSVEERVCMILSLGAAEMQEF